MDTIRLTGVQGMGTHGVLDYEHQRAQPFVVDAVLHLDLSRAGASDDLHDTVDYGRVAKRIVSVIEGDHVDLIERLAALIADAVIADHPAVQGVTVTVHKPKAPITVPFADVSVTIERWRNGHGATAAPAGAADAHAAPLTRHAVIALGGNQGNVAASMRSAIAAIDGLDGTQVTGVSPLYRTAAWGMAEGTPDFRNAVVEVSTTQRPEELLSALQSIEAVHGRTRESHWASRPIDLDIIDFEGEARDDPQLTLPHPRAWQRAFVLAPWHELDPLAVLGGRHGGPVAELLSAAPDRDDVRLESRGWMSAGGAGGDVPAAADVSGGTDADADADAGNGARVDGESGSRASGVSPRDDEAPVSRTAVVSMDSVSKDAEHLFRTAIVALDGIPGNQVEGISPLYHVSDFDGPDMMSAVMQLTTKLDARALVAALGTVESSLPGDIDLDLVDMAGVTMDEPDCRVPWPSAREHASVLAPWMDMDPEARLGKDPVSFLLAMAPDAGRVGMISDNWIIGGTV